MDIFLSIITFYLGASLGSFLSVIIYRHKKNKKGILFGRSSCPKCGKTLAALDLIPVLSFVFTLGRCRNCKKRISPHYVLIELLTGVIFAMLYFQLPFLSFGTRALTFSLNNTIFYIYGAIICVLLIGIFFYDLLYKEIPDMFTYTGIVLAILAGVANEITHLQINFPTPSIKDMVYAVVFAFLIFEGQRILSKGKWIGLGDSILGFMMALVLGWQLFIAAVFIAYALGSIISILMMSFGKAGLKTAIPFGPFLVTGALTAIFFGNFLISTYFNYAY
ncbi:MAG: type IV prepilin leader peptidase PilD, leader peptidase (prepilin peptidase) / N-methyltransferase [Candidatus Peregrinibacteria bacterium GW2011_GWC2_39_14]|nr:MAG: type IV prepilin leader peptidase PilD, leader peptidase (prepilin peptidase) / N-methyltransferase [Candidatus Peregrinibacteria bacterium GW2011_GWC2_39_14]